MVKGINKAEHKRLVDSLLLLEQYLKNEERSHEDLNKAIQYSHDLISAMTSYEVLIKEVESFIGTYEALYKLVKIKFLGYKLRELQAAMPEDEYLKLSKTFRGK